MKISLTLAEGMLGTASNNADLYKEFIESRRPPEAIDSPEVATLPDVTVEIAKGTTVFHRHPTTGKPMIYDYQIKGFFKDACGALRRVAATESAKIKAYKQVIDGTIFIHPRMIELRLPAGGDLGICERPLRAQTAQGERVALARSEEAPPGTVIDFEVQCLEPKFESLIIEWLKYGALRGLGQWRNSGKGRFSYVIR